MRILGIESTCDETGAAVVEDGRKILSNVVSSSIDLHKKYAGIVPEVAAREQVRVIIPVIKEALTEAFGSIRNNNLHKFGYLINAIAVSFGPGLIGSLLVGVETAKTLALALGKPLIPVNHLIGHVYANWLTVDSSQLTEKNREPLTMNHEPMFPAIVLIVSGGHTDLLLMTDHGKFKWLGGTLDDAAGEAFDKVARVLGLGYPGGPEIERAARQWTIDNGQLTIKLPRPMIESNDYDFSFSGLKTAVVNLVHDSPASLAKRGEQFIVHSREAIAYEFEQAVCEVLVSKTIKSARKFGAKSIVVGGGVSANASLRDKLQVTGDKLGIPIFFPLKELSIDNGGMIASAAFYNYNQKPPENIQAKPDLYFNEKFSISKLSVLI